MKNLVSVLLSAGLLGCVTYSGQEINEEVMLEQSKTCCANLSTLPFSNLRHDQPTAISLSVSSPAYVFDEGKSYFAAFQIPGNSVGNSLVVRTFVVNKTIYKYTAEAFIPRLTFLNAFFKPIRAVSLDMTEKSKALGKTRWEAAVQLQAADAYVVVHTGKDERIRTLQMRDSDVGAIFVPMRTTGGMVIANQHGYLTIARAPIGQLEVEITATNR